MNIILKELTDDTLKEIKRFDIVLPEVYAEIFYSKAKAKKIVIKGEDKESALSYVLEKIEHVSNETQKSTTQLHEHVKNAKNAVQKRDEQELVNIEKHLINMEKRINELQKEIYIDNLTHLYNRRWLVEKFLTNETFINDGVFAFIDINKFKDINDKYGHSTGDKVLQIIARVLKKINKSTAIRYAGDEFVVVSTNLTEKELEKILTIVQKNIKCTELKTKNTTFTTNFAFGISNFKKGDNFKKIYQKADKLMYKHKERLNLKITF